MQPTAMERHTGNASTEVADAMVELARAELKLGISHLKRGAKSAATTSALVWVAIWVAHVAIALVCVSPLLAWFKPWPVVIATIAPAVVLAIVLGALAFWRGKALFAQRETTGSVK